LKSNVKVYLYQGFIHAKTIVIDDHVATVGTTNLDIRSFKLNYEINAFVFNTEFSIKCRDTFLNDVKVSKRIEYYEFINRSLWHKLCESICRFISPLA
jgi:cardiolipin synthase